MSKAPSFQFYPGDWLRDEVSGCSLEAQGLWLRMMMIMHDGQTYGQLILNNEPMSPEFIAKKVGISPKKYANLLRELEFAGVINRKENSVIFSGRMERDEHARQLNRARQAKHKESGNGDGNGEITDDSRSDNAEGNAPLTAPSSSSSSSSSEPRKEEKKEAAKAEPKNVDQRKSHPVIGAIQSITGRYPPKELWDDFIDTLGLEIDTGTLKVCFIKWRARGYNPQNYGWATDWYLNGIPTEKTNATGSNNNGRQTSTDRLRDTAAIYDKYPTEAELGREP